MLLPVDRHTLLTLARERITSALESRDPDYPPRRAELETAQGAFVTLRVPSPKGPRLRGCIGQILGKRPLYDTVLEAAHSAAFADPRFPPLTARELGRVAIEISVLSRIEPITDSRLVVPGTHGLLIELGMKSGLLLPQVAAEQNWDRPTFLAQTCRKAGLPPGAWSDPAATISIFTAEVFDESSLRM